MGMFESVGGALGSLVSGIFASDNAGQDREQQRQFAQNGIQWKVQDAIKAGIHPLYALGAPTISASPTGTDFSAFANAGQDIGRAIDATRPPEEKIDAFTSTVRQLTLDKMGLENELLASQIAKLNATQSPGIPSAGNPYLMEGQPNSGVRVPQLRGSLAGSDLVRTDPLSRMSTSSAAPGQEAGAIAEVGWLRTPTGLAPVQSKDSKDRTEEDWAAGASWNIRNRVMPSLSDAWYNPPPKSALPKGAIKWRFNPFMQEYQPVYPPVSKKWKNKVILKLN